MHTLLKNLETTLNEIKLTRGRLTDLHAKDLSNIYGLLVNIARAHLSSEAIAMLKKTFADHRELHIINYYLAISYYIEQDNGDTYLAAFYSHLTKIGKLALMEVVFKQILKHHQSIFIYTTMAQHAERMGNHKLEIETLELLLSKNTDDYAPAKKLGRLYAESAPERSAHYYEIALSRSFASNDFNEAKSIWKLLVEAHPNKTNFFIHWAKKLAKQSSSEQAYDIFSFLLKAQENNRVNSNEAIIKIIKAALEIEVILRSQFFLILRAYKEVYKDHHYLTEFLNLSGLFKVVKSKKTDKPPELLITYINRFEKLIKLDQGSFVTHQSFGLGMIERFKNITTLPSVKPPVLRLICHFQKKRNHEMSLDIALKSLSLCYKKHIVALKIFAPAKLDKLLAAPELEFTQEVLRTLEKPATQKEIHDLLVPAIFNEEEWNRKWRLMRQCFTTSSKLDYTGKKYALAEESIDFNTRTIQALTQTTKIAEKIKIIENYLSYQPKHAPNVLHALLDAIKQIPSEHNELTLFTNVYIAHITQNYKFPSVDVPAFNFKTSYTTAGFIASYNFAPTQHHRALLLDALKQSLPQEIAYVELEKLILHEKLAYRNLVLDLIMTLDNQEIIHKITRKISELYLNHHEAYIILALYLNEHNFPPHLEAAGEVFLKLVKLLAELHRLVAIGKEISRSKRLYGMINRMLFENEILFTYLSTTSNEKAPYPKHIFSELAKQTFHPEQLKIDIHALHEKVRQRSES